MKDPIYVKSCLGKDGMEISIYKIRTMVVGADGMLDDIVGGFDSYGSKPRCYRGQSRGFRIAAYWQQRSIGIVLFQPLPALPQ